MASSEIKQNIVPEEPSLKDLLDLYTKDILLRLNVHHIGTIDSFDPTKQTASATINYKKTFFEPDPLTGAYEPKLVDYPPLIDCPVMFLGGGTSYMSFPVKKGDECFIFFNDRDIDKWFTSGQTGSAVATPRLHSFSDAIILVGIRSISKSIENFDPDNVVIRNGENLFKVGPDVSGLMFGADTIVNADATGAYIRKGNTIVRVKDKVLIQNTSQNMKTLVTNLITQITNLNTQLQSLTTTLSTMTMSGVTPGGGSSGPPIPAASFVSIGVNIASISSNLSTISTNFGALLE